MARGGSLRRFGGGRKVSWGWLTTIFFKKNNNNNMESFFDNFDSIPIKIYVLSPN
jgi:hypothetical protein